MTIPFRLTNALAIFPFMMNTILRSYLDKFVIVYFAHLVIYFKTKEEHLEYVEKVFNTLANH